MRWKNTATEYGAIAKSFHWLIALIVIGLLAVGLYMTGMDFSPKKFQIYTLHKSFGFLLLWLIGLRLVWKIYNRPPPLLGDKAWERGLAHLVHGLIYACLFIMPLSGWLMSSSDTIPDPTIFGFNLPVIVGESADAKSYYETVHEYTAWILMGLIGLHLAGAIKHHFVEKDNTLRRMLPFTKDK